MNPCPFCARIETGDVERWSEWVVFFEPLNPVADGHMLFMPEEHIESAFESPYAAGKTFESAAAYARTEDHPFNLITSAGQCASQTVPHLHVHYVPRNAIDGLHLPWTGQVAK